MTKQFASLEIFIIYFKFEDIFLIALHVRSGSVLTDIFTWSSVTFFVTLNHFAVKLYRYIQIKYRNLNALFDLLTFVFIAFLQNISFQKIVDSIFFFFLLENLKICLVKSDIINFNALQCDHFDVSLNTWSKCKYIFFYFKQALQSTLTDFLNILSKNVHCNSLSWTKY